MTHKLKSQTKHCCLFSPGYLQPYLDEFIKKLSERGYTVLTISGYYDSIAHFGAWIQKKNIPLDDINTKVITQFGRHRCYCLAGHKGNKISRKYARRVQRFISYLCQEGIIVSESTSPQAPLHPHLEKFKDFLQCRGLSSKTIATYEYSTCMLLSLLGKNSKKYNAAKIRQVICDAAKEKSRCEVKKLTTALRSYLRFLTMENLCCPDLDAAVPTVAEWKLSSLPKYISAHEVECIISACDIHTQQGVRDRAIILLLSRLGLRAGDVSNMKMDDIDWHDGTLRVSGKGRREILLPLPQDVGDAVLAYIKNARPPVALDTIFLCLNAPHRSFSTSSSISSIVSAALARAGVTDPPSRGAHLLRHSAATQMLRQGATLEAVSAVLRHQSLNMTGYYAKVDVPRLKQIAQPWPEGALC